MTDSDRFLFDLRNALTPFKASISLLAREWETLGDAERKELALLAHEHLKVVDELLRKESGRRARGEGGEPKG